MKDILKLLIKLQDIDYNILDKRIFIDKVPSRIFEVDEPLKQAGAELDKIKQKNEALINKKKEKERALDDINDKITKMKSRASEIKTNKEYQAHLKEIEALGKEISDIEEEILLLMESLDDALKQQKEREEKVNIETEKINAFKKELDKEVERFEKELSRLKEERSKFIELIEPDVYNTYMTLLNSGNGVAVTRAKGEICLGCNMHVPPQLFVEIKKNEDIIQCPQCRRILYYSEEPNA
ncbi:MAG: C4-type zinc ribbon domain-containing protein [Nitrospirota bacterium]